MSAARPLPRPGRSAPTGPAGPAGRPKPAADPRWCHEQLAGRLVELCGAGPAAALTPAFSLVLDAQRRKETVAWVTDSDSTFFPPDAAASGVDLDALAVVRVPGMRAILSAADRLLRSGAFGMVVLDLTSVPEGGAHAGRRPPRETRVSLAVVSRLAGLARQSDAVALCLTAGPSPAGRPGGRSAGGGNADHDGDGRAAASPLGSQVSLRVETRRRREPGGRFTTEVRATRDRLHRPGWSHSESFRGPEGLF